MVVGERIKAIREAKKLTQEDLERRAGLLRFYTSRVENGHTVPSVQTMERFAKALEVPVYRLFYDGEVDPSKLKLPVSKDNDPAWGANGREGKWLREFSRFLSRMNERDRKLLLTLAIKMATGFRSLRRSKSS